MQVLEAIQSAFPHHEQQVSQMKTYYNNKYWFQFGEALLFLTAQSDVQQSDLVLRIFEAIFDNPTVNMDKITLVILANRAVDRIPALQDKLAFFARVEEFIKHPKSRLLLRSHKALVLTAGDKLVEALELLRSLEPEITSLNNAEKIIYSTFFKSTAFYHLKTADYQKFYSYSLQYLAYINEAEISEAEKEDVSVNMAIAILVSEKIFNFSELLEQRVFQSLRANERFGWLYALMETFNSGDVNRFQQDLVRFDTYIQANPALNSRREILQDKIKIMAFAELIFSLPKNSRVVSFELISRTTSIPAHLIELMIIKAMSLELLRGSIDQVAQSVSVTWIQPRVLNLERIGLMRAKFADWQQSLTALLKFVDEYKQSL